MTFLKHPLYFMKKSMCLGNQGKAILLHGFGTLPLYNVPLEREKILFVKENIGENRQCRVSSYLRYLHTHEMASESFPKHHACLSHTFCFCVNPIPKMSPSSRHTINLSVFPKNNFWKCCLVQHETNDGRNEKWSRQNIYWIYSFI